jgi:dihydroorotate dehydrogenase (fumarate)
MDLRTTYLGMELANPLVPSASPLSRSLDFARRLEDAGAPALVMYSLFEEELLQDEHTRHYLHHQEIGHPEADSFLPLYGEFPGGLDEYLQQLSDLKSALDIPIIASLNGISASSWIDHGKELQAAGADALELNVYYVAADPTETGAEVERRYVEILRELKEHVTLPIMMKLSPQFSSPAHMVHELAAAGADGVALFNRFYQPDIDVDSLQVAPRLQLSTSAELLLPLRWIALLHGRVDLTLAATSGLHTAEDALKLLLAGADVTHMCSALLENGPEYLGRVLNGIERWLDESPYDSLEQLKGMLSAHQIGDPSTYARANYVTMIESYQRPPGTWR